MSSRKFHTFSIVVILALFGTSGFAQRLDVKEAENHAKQFQHWWGHKLIWKFHDLPKSGSVAKERLPYSGHIYPDRAGGTEQVLRKYDRAFHGNRPLAVNYEKYDIRIHATGGRSPGDGLLAFIGLGNRIPRWSGHCNGWVAAAIRHAEPENNVVRNGVVFTPADIKGLLAELYTYTDSEFLAGTGNVVNPAMLHISLGNWLGRGKMPIGMDKSVGEEVWNYPIYAYSSSAGKQKGNTIEVKTNVAYVDDAEQEYDRGPANYSYLKFHYNLMVNDKGEIVGGTYYRDSARIDMLWAPLKPTQGGQAGNEAGNPYLNLHQVLALWRDSVPAEKRANWWNIDPIEEDRVLVAEAATGEQAPQAETQSTEGPDAEEQSAEEQSAEEQTAQQQADEELDAEHDLDTETDVTSERATATDVADEGQPIEATLPETDVATQ